MLARLAVCSDAFAGKRMQLLSLTIGEADTEASPRNSCSPVVTHDVEARQTPLNADVACWFRPLYVGACVSDCRWPKAVTPMAGVPRNAHGMCRDRACRDRAWPREV